MGAVPPPPGSGGQRRMSLGGAEGSCVDVLVTDSERKTPKYLVAAAQGCAALTPQWVHDCCAASRLLAPGTKAGYMLRPPALQLRDQPVLHGVRVHLAGEARFRETFGAIVRHGGALLLDHVEAAAGGGGGAVSEAAVDVVLYDGELTAAERERALRDVQRAARRLRIPVHDHEWVVSVLLSAQLPDGFLPTTGKASQEGAGVCSPEVGGRAGGRRSGRRSSAALRQQPQQQQQQGVQGAGRAPSQEAAPAGQQQQQQQARKRARHETTPTAQQSPAPAAAAAAAAAAATATPPPSSPALTPGPATSPAPAAGPSASAVSAPITWLGAPLPAPAGATAAAQHRQHYAGFTKAGTTIKLGDCVLLPPGPADSLPVVARIEALWQEVPSDGVPRQLARCARFYRPSETIFPLGGPGGQQQVFSSGHVEERVALAAVVGRCWVVMAGAGLPRGAVPACVFHCSFHYNHVDMTLGAAVAGGTR
jgi:hypothetical protein